MVEFASWLQARLTQGKVSPSGLARQLDIHPSTVSRWLAAETRPRVEVIHRLSEVLDENATTLLTLAGYPSANGASEGLSPEETKLIAYFRKLGPDQRDIVVAAARGLT